VSILERLSSARGDPSEASNKAVAAEALEHPDIMDEVAAGLALDDHKLLSLRARRGPRRPLSHPHRRQPAAANRGPGALAG
jgi:hypothetical protein